MVSNVCRWSICRCFLPIFVGTLLLLTVGARFAFCAAQSDQRTDFADLSVEELMNIEITSVAKKPQKLSRAASAVFVITADDIRRSGVTSIPEALRMVPGIQVARIDASKWAISARGFNGRFANKLLVLIDGRTVYTPLFSGVYWELQDTLLEDIDRIEVIRGPGATLWGANAVNGVINIITRQAKNTQGTLMTAGAGTEEQGFGSVRYGGNLSEEGYYRAYAKYDNRDGGVYASGDDAADQWHKAQGGFRTDWDGRPNTQFTFQGDIYEGDGGETVEMKSLTPPYTRDADQDIDFSGVNLLARCTHTLSETSNLTLQLYYDRAKRMSTVLGLTQDTYDIDFQHQFHLGKAHDIVLGCGYRLVRDEIDNTFLTSFYPESRNDSLYSAFVQDDITLIEDYLWFTLGSKFEHNDYTGFEYQPSCRILWTPAEHHSVWTAVSRAVRTPCRAEDDIRINSVILPAGSLLPAFSGPGVGALIGNRDFESEDLMACELGYRVVPADKLSFDFAAFYNQYDDLRTLEQGAPYLETTPLPPHLVIPYYARNKMDGETYGVEVAADWDVFEWWRLRVAYTWLQMQLHLDKDSRDTASESAEGDSPHNQVSVRSSLRLANDIELDIWLRYVDNLPNQQVGKYITLDTRVGWKPSEALELSVVGQNLLDSQHQEFVPEIIDTTPTEVERSVYAKMTWRF